MLRFVLGSGLWLGLWGRLEGSVVPDGLFHFTIVASKAQPAFLGGFERTPSINGVGSVSFVGRSGAASTTESMTLADGSGTAGISLVRNFSQFQQVNDSGVVVAQDIGSGGGIFKTFIRQWRKDGSVVKVAEAGVGAQVSLIAIPGYGLNLPGVGFLELVAVPPIVTVAPSPLLMDLVAYPSINNHGAVAYVGTGGPAGQLKTWLMLHDGVSTTQLHEFPIGSLRIRPSLSDPGLLVARAGGQPTDPILVYRQGANPAVVAGPTTGFAAVGEAPGISDDGRVMVFYGELTAGGAAEWNLRNGEAVPVPLAEGPGIFAVVSVDHRQYLVRIAGINPGGAGSIAPGLRRPPPKPATAEGPDFNFDGIEDWNIAGLEADARVSVSSLQPFAVAAKGSSAHVVYLGLDSSGGTTTPALFVSRLNLVFHREKGVERVGLGVEAPVRVVRAGPGQEADELPGFGRIRALGVNDAVNGAEEIAFWAGGDGGAEAIVKAARTRQSLLAIANGVKPSLTRELVTRVNDRPRFDPDSPLVEHVIPGVPGRAKRLATNQLILHATVGNKTTSLVALAKDNEKSIHYLVTRDGQVIQILPESAVANHAGNARHFKDRNSNTNSIGIELVDDCIPSPSGMSCRGRTGHRDNPDWLTAVQKAKLALLCRDICRRNGIPLAVPSPFPALHFPGGDRPASVRFEEAKQRLAPVDGGFTEGSANPKLVKDSAIVPVGGSFLLPVTDNDVEPLNRTLEVEKVHLDKKKFKGTVEIVGGGIRYTAPDSKWSGTVQLSYLAKSSALGVEPSLAATVTWVVSPTAKTAVNTTPAQSESERQTILDAMPIRDGFGPDYPGVLTHGQVLNRATGKDDPSPRNAFTPALVRELLTGNIALQTRGASSDERSLGTGDPRLAGVFDPIGLLEVEPQVTFDDALVVARDGSGTVNVVENDNLNAPEAQSALVEIVGLPVHGVVEQDPDFPQFLTYTPTPGYTGTDNFSYRLAYEEGDGSPPAAVQVEVHDPASLADLAVAWVTDRPLAAVGGEVVGDLLVWNHGPAEARDVRVELPLPAGWNLVSHALPDGATATREPGLLRFHFEKRPPGETALLQVVLARTPESVELPDVRVSSAGVDPDPLNNRTPLVVPSTPNPPPIPRPILRAQLGTDGAPRLELWSDAPGSFDLETSINLADWAAVVRVDHPGGQWGVLPADPDGSGPAVRFFRVRGSTAPGTPP